MKLDRVVLHGFLSHGDTDWSPDGARLVTLAGPNGAGKSSLASDALLYALFDSARGRTDDLVQLGSSDMAVTVEFAYAGDHYRVTRGRTTRSGGKSFLELGVADGDAWRPLTADSIRETQALIEELLHVDAATFTTAALLVQGRANQFAEATAKERHTILATALDLVVWSRAEAIAREHSRDVDARLVADREQASRLTAVVQARDWLEAALTKAREQRERLEVDRDARLAEREELEVKLRELAGKVADQAAALAELRRLQDELLAQRTRWTTAQEQKVRATDSIARATRTIETVGDVDAAKAAIAELSSKLAALDERERLANSARASLTAEEERLRTAEASHASRLRDWQGRKAELEGHVLGMAEAVERLEPVTCPKCGEEFAADPADLAGRLEAARQALSKLGPEPAEPQRLQAYRAGVARATTKLQRLVDDPGVRISFRQQLVEFERIAALADQVEQAHRARDDWQQQLEAADAELAAIDVAGREARAAVTTVQERIIDGGRLGREAMDLEARKLALGQRITALEVERDATAAEVVRAEAQLAALEQTETERAELLERVQAGSHELALARRLVSAFGAGGIPARIIESVLPELSGYANELLAELRPGMSLEIRGQRAKKDGSGVIESIDLIVRDDVGERALALFSGGERMSVSLALAVGLSRLVARRAGTAIRTLVIDEPDGLDAEARRAFGQALRVLAHRGELERVVLVSHHQDLADVGDAVYQVSRNGRGSIVEQVA